MSTLVLLLITGILLVRVRKIYFTEKNNLYSVYILA